MSDWQLNQDKGIAPQIAMPPLPPEEPQQPEPVQEVAQEQESSVAQEEQPVDQSIAQETRKYDNDRNIRAIREEARRLKAENERLIRESQQRSAKPQEDESEYDLRSDDIAEGKHLNKVNQKIRQLESKLEMSNIELRLKSQFPDFDRVVTQDSLQQLQDEHPEIYQTIYSSNDMYNKAASAYTIMKKLKIGVPDESERERQQALKNAVKPRTVTSISPQQGNTPLSQANAFANGLTAELQAQLIKEMNTARKGY
jgi:hypothetical protein